MTDPAPRVVSTGTCCGAQPATLAGKPQVPACILCPESPAWWRSPDRPAQLVVREDKTGRFVIGMAAPEGDGQSGHG